MSKLMMMMIPLDLSLDISQTVILFSYEKHQNYLNYTVNTSKSNKYKNRK